MRIRKLKITAIGAYGETVVKTIDVPEYNWFERVVRWVRRKLSPPKRYVG